MIDLTRLSTNDVTMVGVCLRAAADGPFFPDWEFETLFGLSREEVRAAAEGWPANAARPEVEIAVYNSLSNLGGYPHCQPSALKEVVGEQEEIRALIDRVRAATPEAET
jgi:hypothetical protein